MYTDYFTKKQLSYIEELKADGYKPYYQGFGVPTRNDKRAYYYKVTHELHEKGIDWIAVFGKRYYNAYNWLIMTKEEA